MRLNYRILWFEDNDSWFASAKPFIEEFLDENGFYLNVKREINGQNVDTLLGRPNFDLILIDLNLAGIKGDELINAIRDHKIFTEIIFYSQNGERAVRDIIMKKGADGVYCASREADEFEDKVKKVIETTIKKVLEINNLRGLVLAETSELDKKMEKFLLQYFKIIQTDISNPHKKNIKEKTLKSYQDRIEKLTKINEIESIELLLTEIDSYGKWRTIKRVCKTEERYHDFLKIFEEYNKEVIMVRNILAHVSEDILTDGTSRLKSTIKGNEEFVFDDKTSIDIRKNLKKHYDNLEQAIQIIG